jgi:hypothetical protein
VATPGLSSDCSNCFGLCCVLLPFSASAGFGIDKPGGRPCHHLLADDGCEIHDTLRQDGWPGCTVFECFGAGQQVSQVTYAGVSWREQDNLPEMAAVLSVMRQLHEMLVHLDEVERRTPDPGARAAAREVEDLTRSDPETLLLADVDALHARVGQLLGEASARVRRRWPAAGDRTRADLAGKALAGDRRGWSFRGALMIGADLRGSDLTDTDLLGTDLRGADVRGCDLSTTLFLTQPQVNAATGDATTTLPDGLVRPGHWGVLRG